MEPIVVTAPPKGESFYKTMDSLSRKGIVPRECAEYLIAVVKEDKDRIKREEKDGYRYTPRNDLIRKLSDLRDENEFANHLCVQANNSRKGRPYRIVFDVLDAEVAGLPIRVEGVEHFDAPSYLVGGNADIAVVGYDEVAAYNSAKEKDYRIMGSAGLYDFTAHFLVCDDDKEIRSLLVKKHAQIAVDHKYKTLYAPNVPVPKAGSRSAVLEMNSILKNCRFLYTEKAEEHVRKNGGAGIVIVNTGRTVKNDGLFVYSVPPIQSETIVICNGFRYKNNSDIRKVLSHLGPIDFDDSTRRKKFREWYESQIGKNIGEKWVRRPDIHLMEGMYKQAWGKEVWKAGRQLEMF